VHLILENDGNESRYLARDAEGRALYQAQWNDDIHHCLHVLITGEQRGYYADYQPPLPALGRCLTEGFAYQGERSAYRNRPRGEPSRELPPTAFVGFLQNHDQIGNRPFGDRITKLAAEPSVRAATAVLLLAPSLPLIFMGEEWAAAEPFLFFSDLGGELGAKVAEGRRNEFAHFPEFAHPDARRRIPDPQSVETRRRSVLNWSALTRSPHREWLQFHRELFLIREKEIVPLLAGAAVPRAGFTVRGERVLEARWAFPGNRVLRLCANMSGQAARHDGPSREWGRRLYGLGLPVEGWSELPAWSVAWYLDEAA